MKKTPGEVCSPGGYYILKTLANGKVRNTM